jgi:cell division protein FtsL
MVRRLSKRAQMKIQQMVFMIIAVFILFVIIGMIFLSSRISNVQKTATEIQELNALTLASKIANSPEFSCGNSYGNQISDCVDLDKVMALKKSVNNYESFWGVSNIEIRKIYPSEEEKECNDENYPNCNWINVIEEKVSGYSVGNFVSICYKELNGQIASNKCEIGKIIISYEVAE